MRPEGRLEDAAHPKPTSASMLTRSMPTRSMPSATRPLISSMKPTKKSEAAEEPDLRDLNSALLALAEIFPDVRPDVFREMLSNLSAESRLHVVADQLLRYGARWIRGRWRVAANVSSSRILSEVFEARPDQVDHSNELLPPEDKFRSATYKAAARSALRDEFQDLSRTAIEGVLVEQNYSYTNSRPILTGLAAKSWRTSLKSLIRWKKPSSESHFMLVQPKADPKEPPAALRIKETGSTELDAELYQTILQPLLDEKQRQNERVDWELAISLNEEEAISHDTTFECECCFGDVPFESIAFCSTGEHRLCFKCLQNTVSAALYAQAWAKSIDHRRSQLFCFAPTAESCGGCIPNYLTKRAVLQARGGQQIWDALEEKLAKEALQGSKTRLVQCPFCHYAESEDVWYPHGLPRFKPNRMVDLSNFLLLLVVLCSTALLCWQYFWLSLIFPLPQLRPCFERAFKALARRHHLSLRFTCRNPLCAQPSCRICRAAWRDPHKCNEREELTLRTTVEAARSAAMKRVCPKCNLAFVKESGCNKMTCTCGYTMCYLCRQGLGQQPKGLTNPHHDHDYSHFCGHFRSLPGRCWQCNKCDLYREENQDEIVRRAGEVAEKEWRKKMGKKLRSKDREETDLTRYDNGLEGKLQMLVDHLVETYVTC